MTDKYHPRNHPLTCAYHVDQYPFECNCGLFAEVSGACDLGVGCDETGTCYALAHGRPEICGKANWDDKSAAVQIGHEIGMSAEDFTRLGDGIVKVLRRYRTEIITHVRCEIIHPHGELK